MKKAMFAAVLVFGCAAMTTTALAGASLAEAWYVKKDGASQAMLADRTGCIAEAEQFGVDRANDFSNPEYGSLTALGAALDEDALRGDAKQAVRRAVRDACMQKHGWTRVDVSDADAKLLKKANPRHPEALDAWLVANAPKPAPAPVQAPAASSLQAAAPASASASAPANTPEPAAPKP